MEIASNIATGKPSGCMFSPNCQDNFMSIAPTGDVMQCGRFCDNDLLQYSYGNLHNETLVDIMSRIKQTETYKRGVYRSKWLRQMQVVSHLSRRLFARRISYFGRFQAQDIPLSGIQKNLCPYRKTYYRRRIKIVQMNIRMKTKFTWFGIIAIVILGISTFFVGCKDDMNDLVVYKGQVVYMNTTTPFADLTVKVTDGYNTHCQTQTDAGGLFELKVRVNEIDGSYYLLAGDETCIPKKVSLGGYGQAEVDLGVIEVEGPALPTVKTDSIRMEEVTADGAIIRGEVLTDGRLAVTARGVCYGTNPDPVTDGLHTTEGSGLGAFTSTLKDLEHNTIYYARAYATNRMGTAYGDQVKFTTELGVPIVITDSVIRITANSAKCKGHVESDGGYAVSKKGTCWSKQPDPTVDDECTNDGSGKGEFTSTLSGLLENTTYYVRTYATNATATVYGEQIIITTLDGLAVVKTDSINNITATGFTAFGTVVSDCDISVKERGFCYSTSQYPTIEDTHIASGKGLGDFKSNITKLEYGTTYYIRAYATNATATTYGNQIEITTLVGLPTVTTDSVSNIGSVKATCGGNVTDDGTLTVTARGVCYGTEPQPTIEDTHTTDGKGTGKFVSNLKNLSDKTTYYIRAYATTAAGTAYGEQRTFKTENGIPVVILPEIGEPTANSITCKGNVTGDGGVTITERGFCYGSTQYPTNTDAHIAIGNGVGEFSGSITKLNINTTYYVRAYAINSLGIGYSEQKSFTTKNGLPTVLTSEPSATATTITVGGNITDNGGYAVTERGVCYSASNFEPTITDKIVEGGQGNGEYSVTITGLSANTTYYVRAYAKNTNGTAYGKAVSVSTKDGNASVLLGEITDITAQKASTSVTVNNTGSATLQSCGICWSTNPTPTTADNKTTASGKALNVAYPCNMTELQPGTTYYVRAYATTDVTTAYSEARSFSTKIGKPIIATGTVTSTATTITCAGNISDNGGYAVTERGICYSQTNSEPTILDQKVASGSGNGEYQVTIKELTPATSYYVRAYATNTNGTSYGEAKATTTKNGEATIVLESIDNITALTASGKVMVTDAGGTALQSCGICWSTNPNPTVADNKTAASGKSINTAYICNMTNLQPKTNYYVRGYVITDIATSYSSQTLFETKDGLPVLSTATTTATSIKITSGGNITSDGGYSIITRGICYSTTNSAPTIEDDVISNGSGTGTFTSFITNVSINTTYYVRAYATNAIGIAYGDAIAVTTGNGLPSVITTSIGENVTSTTATGGGNVTDDGGFIVSARGICWSTLPSPTITDNHTTDGSGKGYFTSNITNIDITGDNVYYVRAYATNTNGTVYGETVTISKENLDYANLPSFQYGGYTYKLYNDIGTMDLESAQNACESLTFGGYNDWFLPSVDELRAAYNATKEGWKGDDYQVYSNYVEMWGKYWTSSESSSYYYCAVLTVNKYSNGNTYDFSQSTSLWSATNHVRPVRKYKTSN